MYITYLNFIMAISYSIVPKRMFALFYFMVFPYFMNDLYTYIYIYIYNIQMICLFIKYTQLGVVFEFDPSYRNSRRLFHL